MPIESYFLNRPDKTEAEEYDKLYKELRELVPSDQLDSLCNVSFLMLKPNAYLQGLFPELIQELNEAGIHIVNHKLGQLSETELDQLYLFVKQKYIESWWVMKRAYELAPSLPLLVVGEHGSYQHLSARLRDLVGPTTPITGGTNQWRYKFRSANRLFNTVHATDDPATAIREALVFFSWEDISQAIIGPQSETHASANINVSTLLPDIVVEISSSRTRNTLKQQIINRVDEMLLADQASQLKNIRDLSKSIQHLLDVELKVCNMRLPLRDEYQQIRTAMAMQKLTSASIYQEVARITTRSYRHNQVAGTELEHLVATATQVLDLIELFTPLADEADLFTISDFEIYLGRLVAQGITMNALDEVLLLGGWAVSYNELLNVTTDWAGKLSFQD